MDLPFAKEILTTGGPLGVLVVVVYMFLKYSHTMSVEHRTWMGQILETHADAIKAMHQDNLIARESSRQVIVGNTAAMIENTKALAQLSATVVTGPFKPRS